jgi:hypothetical protein
MEPLQIAARFTAFVCYLNASTAAPCSPKEAGRLARENWKRFLPFVDQDVARFVTAVPRSLGARRPHSSASGMRHARSELAV